MDCANWKTGDTLRDRFGMRWRLLAPVWNNFAWVLPLLHSARDPVPQSIDCDMAGFGNVTIEDHYRDFGTRVRDMDNEERYVNR